MEKRPVVPGQHGMGRKKVTDYGTQLREKQKVKRAYGLLEKQFKQTYERATRMKGVVGDNMLSLLERRLDNVIYRMGIGDSRMESRQIVNHGHICVNGKVVDIPSYTVEVGDEISVKESHREQPKFKQLRGIKIVMPKWLEFNTDTMVGKILDLPKRDDIDLNIQEHLIIELYSK
jgi:small subunit ribosomal protein S4